MVKIRKPSNKEISIVKSKINQEFNKQKNQTKCSMRPFQVLCKLKKLT